MAYEITPEDFCLIVKNPRCQGTETPNGLAKEGHVDCSFCKGNYFVGGQCNYGGCHVIAEDLKEINRNFKAFDVLVKQQIKLSKSQNEQEFNDSKSSLLNSFKKLKDKCEEESGIGFFYGSCVGLDGSQSQFADRIKFTFERLAKELGHYMKEVTNSTWQQLHKFQEKLKQLDKLSQEANQLTEDWKNETDPVKKSQLFALLSTKNQAIKNLREEIRNDPNFTIFNQEKSDELANIVKNIFQGNPDTSFFKWKRKEVPDKLEEKKWLGFIPAETGQNVLLIIGGLLGLAFIYWLIKRQFKE